MELLLSPFMGFFILFQKMESLPNEVVFLILDYLLLTTIRKFSRICNYVNVITKELVVRYEKKYFVGEFEKFNKYSVEKFTFELFHDNYGELIPEQYMTVNNPMLVIYPAYFNNISFLETLNENNKFNMLLKKHLCKSAIKNGQLYVLEWAFHNNYNYDISLSLVAIKYNQLELLKWLHKNGFELHKNICVLATLHDNLNILKWARKKGFNYDSRICDASAWSGHLEILIYANLTGCVWGSKTCANAAKNGHLNCLQYLHENGCEWDSKTCSKAAKHGHLNCLKYAHENGCGFYPDPNPTASVIVKLSYVIDHITEYDEQLHSLIEQEALLEVEENVQINYDEAKNIHDKILCYSYISEKNEYTVNYLMTEIKPAVS